MNNNSYNKAVNYAAKLVGYGNHRDLVHDSYLTWRKKTGRNLFEEHEGTVLTTVKYSHMANITRSRFMWRGTLYNRSFFDYQESEDLNMLPLNLSNPEQQLMYNQSLELSKLLLQPEEKKLLTMLKLGYTPREIAEREGTYKQQINHRVRRIKKRLKQLI